jgi:acyl carrier protein phosphodiesterase
MNFLSHVYLSGNSEGLIIGNFIADSVKGSAFNNFSPAIQQGILLHRKIDTYTDTHPIVEESKKRLRANYRKYASVIVDVYYDHFLSANWRDYSSETLANYTQNIYALVLAHNEVLPLKSQLFTKYMIQYDILVAYSRLEGIERVLTGMSKRTTFQSNMEHAIHDLKAHYDLFQEEFRLFFPELKLFVAKEIELLGE